MLLKGRRKIVSEYSTEDMLDIQKVANLVNTAMVTHLYNKSEIDYLVEYKNGVQPILNKEKVVREEINNVLVINHAQMITRNIIGYFLGSPIQYIQSGFTTNKEGIDMLNRFVQYEDKASSDKELGEFASICGTAYRIIYTDGLYADEVPFEEKSLNPSTTFVVYENNISEKPLVGVTYYTLMDSDGKDVGFKVYAYTEHGLYQFITDMEHIITSTDESTFSPYKIGGVPIVEYPNNQWRLGDWELCIGLMDAINGLQSGRMDDIDQVVQSLLVFINADIDADRYAEMREQGVVLLKNMTGNQSSVESVNNSLDQAGMHLFSEEMETLLYALIGIPDRNNRAGGGGDTGQAVELRDGWADLEIIARNKELSFKKSEKQSLRIILNIMNGKLGGKLSLLDIDIKFSRNKNNNLLVKTQGYSTLLSTKTLSPADCLTIVDLVSDVNEYITRGQQFWGASFAGLEQSNTAVENSKVSLDNAKNPPATTASTDVVNPVNQGGN